MSGAAFRRKAMRRINDAKRPRGLRRALLDARSDWLKAQKARPCHDCGVTFPHYAMDFDHVPERGPKLFTIASNLGRSIEVLEAEIAKCDLVCANCHRSRTHHRGYAGGRPRDSDREAATRSLWEDAA